MHLHGHPHIEDTHTHTLQNFTDGYANTQTVHVPTRKTTQLFGGKISASCFHITIIYQSHRCGASLRPQRIKAIK